MFSSHTEYLSRRKFNSPSNSFFSFWNVSIIFWNWVSFSLFEAFSYPIISDIVRIQSPFLASVLEKEYETVPYSLSKNRDDNDNNIGSIWHSNITEMNWCPYHLFSSAFSVCNRSFFRYNSLILFSKTSLVVFSCNCMLSRDFSCSNILSR